MIYYEKEPMLVILQRNAMKISLRRKRGFAVERDDRFLLLCKDMKNTEFIARHANVTRYASCIKFTLSICKNLLLLCDVRKKCYWLFIQYCNIWLWIVYIMQYSEYEITHLTKSKRVHKCRDKKIRKVHESEPFICENGN